MKRVFCSLFLIITCFPALFSQTPEEENLARYWKYRERFSKYFIYPGTENGEGHVVCIRNRIDGTAIPANLDFGQHGIHFGYYLGMLSTEYLLLSIYGQAEFANQTLEELRLALKAYCEQMDKCETIWGKEKILDGFFVRENVPLDFMADTASYGPVHKEHFNDGLTPENLWNKDMGYFTGVPDGHPAWVERTNVRKENDKEPMSQDEAYGVMMGLALVARCVPELKEEATKLYEMIVLHIINKNPNYDCSGIGYYIYKPDCKKVSESGGGNTATLGYGIAAAAAAVTGKEMQEFMSPFSNKQVKAVGEKPYNVKFYDRLMKKGTMKTIWNFVRNGAPGNQEWNRSMISTLGAMGDSWYPKTEKGITKNTLHTSGKTHDWRSFYLTLWRFLFGQSGKLSEKELIMSELTTAPWEGPYNYASPQHPDNYAGGGWAHMYRYRATHAEQYNGIAAKGIFNGLDYMLMYNLYHLVYAPDDKNIPLYMPSGNNQTVSEKIFATPNWNIKNDGAFKQKVKIKKNKDK